MITRPQKISAFNSLGFDLPVRVRSRCHICNTQRYTEYLRPFLRRGVMKYKCRDSTKCKAKVAYNTTLNV